MKTRDKLIRERVKELRLMRNETQEDIATEILKKLYDLDEDREFTESSGKEKSTDES